MNVYLAGGHHSDWRREVCMACPEHTFFNPMESGLEDPTAYTLWDRMAIERSDIVFAYLEDTNPSGLGLAFEVGYAIGLHKPVIFVCNMAGPHGRYAEMMGQSAYATYYTLAFGIACLAGINPRPSYYLDRLINQ